VKSTWPGVSIRLTTWFFQPNVIAAAVIEIPRSCSCVIQSVTVEPSSTSPSREVTPE